MTWLEQKVRAIRARAAVRQWEFRQRRLAKGAWDRFRLPLAMAAEAYAIDATEAELLEREGCRVDPAGCDLEPPRRLIWISRGRLARLASARPIALHLDAALLAEPVLALVPFT